MSASDNGDAARDLASLIAPSSPAVFYDHFGRKARLHIKTANPDRTASLLPWQVINGILAADSLPPDRFQLVRNGNIIPASMFRRGGEANGPIRFGALHDLLRQGASMFLNDVDPLVPAIGSLAAAIERELDCNVWTNVYLSFSSGGAFGAHYDLHDSIIVQVHGRKLWKSFGTPHPSPVEKFSTADRPGGDTVWEDTLEAGDILYLPRGEIHAAALERGLSVHLTLGLARRRGLDFAKAAVAQAAQDALLRQDIPLDSDDAAAGYEAAVKQSLDSAIGRAAMSRFLERERQIRRLRPLVNLGLVPPYHAGLVVEPALRRRIPLSIEIDGDAEIVAGGEKFRLTAPARRVLHFLVWQNASTVATLSVALQETIAAAELQLAIGELASCGLVGVREP